MRILITGCTGLQCGKDTKLKILTAITLVHDAMKEILKDTDSTIDFRPTIPGEDLCFYDKVFVGIAPFGSWSTPYIYGALYALANHNNVVAYVDDWQCHGYKSGFRKMYEGNHDLIFSRVSKNGIEMVNKEFKKEALSVREDIIEGVRLLGIKMHIQLMVPLFEHGDASLLDLPSDEVIKFDPSSYFKGYLKNNPTLIKEKAWISAQITASESFRKKLSFNWPSKDYGLKRNKEERLPEPELARVYAQTWGNVCPPHSHTKKGSGWWRVRFLMSYEAHCIMIGHKGEMAPWGESFTHTYEDIECMSDTQLKNLAADQRKDYERTVWSEDDFLDFIEGMLSES